MGGKVFSGYGSRDILVLELQVRPGYVHNSEQQKQEPELEKDQGKREKWKRQRNQCRTQQDLGMLCCQRVPSMDHRVCVGCTDVQCH